MKSVPEGGNSANGELVYRRTGCVACHAIGGVGGNFGPDFSSIGAEAAAIAMTLVSGDLHLEDRPDKPFATASFTAAKPATQPVIFTGIEAAWLEGKPLELKDGRCTTSIPAGDHQLTVRPDRKALLMKAQCDDVSFVSGTK